jgi:hypothetical protein
MKMMMMTASTLPTLATGQPGLDRQHQLVV